MRKDLSFELNNSSDDFLKIVKVFVICITILLSNAIAGCSNLIPLDYKFEPSKSMGVIALSTTSHLSSDLVRGNLNLFSFIVQPINKNAAREGALNNSLELHNVCNGGFDWNIKEWIPGTEFGCLGAFELPAGDYALTMVEVVGGGVQVKNIEPLHFEFQIIKGKVNYFGNLMIDIPTLSQAHLSKTTTLIVKRSNKRDRDIPLLLKKYPNFHMEDIIVDSKEE